MNKSKIATVVTLVVSFAIGVVSCVHEPINPYSGQCSPDSVYFENDVLPLIIGNCGMSGCHDAATASDGVILDSYENIMSTGEVRAGRPDNSEIYEKISENDPADRMPPPPANALSSEQMALIRDWIDQGALNNSCENKSTSCDTSTVALASSVRPILSQYCQGCHNNTSASGGVNLEDYAGLKTVADDGRLLGAVRQEAGYSAMPQGQGKISDCNISTLEIWIRNGAQNN
jgi:hypothetical protein